MRDNLKEKVYLQLKKLDFVKNSSIQKKDEFVP